MTRGVGEALSYLLAGGRRLEIVMAYTSYNYSNIS